MSAKASFDGHLHPATVVEIQRRNSTKKKDFDDGEGEIEKYYIHYDKFDKRLDEWVSAENVHDYTAAGDGLFDESEAQNGGVAGSANKMMTTQTNGAVNTNGESTPHSATNPLLSSNNKNSHSEGTTTRKLTRTMKRRYNEIHNVDGVSVEDLPRIDQLAEKEHEEKTKMKNIQCVQFGKYEMDAWYYSPYPEITGQCDMLYVCPYCMKYMRKPKTMQKHQKECTITHPPGKKIYEHENANDEQTTICFWEIDGKEAKTYCQNLCLVAKLFLDHKTLYYDVDLFLFYVLCEWDERGYHVVGYFSKEKCSEEGYNLACILTLPPYQRKGYGKLLIAFSYELSKKEGKVGTPERPLSDLGLVSYRGYWTRELLALLADPNRQFVSIKDLSDLTMIKTEDIITTLQHLNLLAYQKGAYVICAAPDLIQKHLKNAGGPGVRVDAKKIIWTPYNADKEYEKYRG